MKKDITKKKYEQPSMEVLTIQQTLLLQESPFPDQTTVPTHQEETPWPGGEPW